MSRICSDRTPSARNSGRIVLETRRRLVQRDDDRDRAIDRALRDSHGARLTGSRGALADEHIDGERLAAWSEGSLRPDEATIIERHLADCSQCQQLLAVFA